MAPQTKYPNRESLSVFLERRREDQKFMRSLEVGSTLLLISFFALFALRPAFDVISALVGEIRSKDALSKQLNTKIRNIIEAQDNFSKIQKDYSLIESCLPDLPRYAQASQQVQLAAKNNNINFSKIAFNIKEDDKTPEQKKSNIDSYQISAISQASFYPAISFLSKLHNNRRLLDIESLSFANSKKGSVASPSAESAITFNLNARLYFWNPPNDKK